MTIRMKNQVVFAFTSIIWLQYTSPRFLDVADASPPSPCREFPCPHNFADGITGTRNSDNDSNGNDHPPHRNLASPAYEAYYTNEVEAWLIKKRTDIESSVFVSYDSEGHARPSTAYAFDDFLATLRSMSVDGAGGADDQVLFYLGEAGGDAVRGLVNVAAFLAHAMAVSIRHDACDEFHADATDGTQKYAVSNACGQWGRSYQDEVCGGDEASLTCGVDPNMVITAFDAPEWEGAPPPLECRPRESELDFTGHWDAEVGALSEVYPYANRAGVMHNEGCCWWGRGVLMTRGTCNFGKLNHYLGRPAAEKGYILFYDVDLCIYPEIVCEGEDTRSLRWTVGYFEWADRVQSYQNSTKGLDYMKDLNTFVDSGFLDVNRFIDVVGNALPFGCVEADCMAAEEKVTQDRRDNFIELVFNVLELPYLVEATPFPSPPPTHKPTQDGTPPPTPWPTPRPTKQTTRPTPQPTSDPTQEPTQRPTITPTKPPTKLPTFSPTALPTKFPTARPSSLETKSPTSKPTARQTQSPTGRPTAGQTSPPQQSDTICYGQSSTFVPVEECREYVQCVNGIRFSQNTCASGLLFDSKLNTCNWESSVICTAPTKTPTSQPTQRPTRRTPEPTPEPLERTAQPFHNAGQIDLSPPPPTVSPSIGPVMVPAITSPPFDFTSQADGRNEGSNNPNYSQKPTYEEESLIILPSGASLVRGNIIFSIGMLCIGAVGAYIILL